MKVRAQTVAAITVVIGTWLACGPLTDTQSQPERLPPVVGLDSGSGSGSSGLPGDSATEGSGSNADAPFDTPTEGGGSNADAPFDAATEGGSGSDGGSGSGSGSALPDAGLPDAFVPDARPDASIPDARPDAAIDAPSPPDDGAGIIDAPGSGSARRDAGSGSNVTATNLDETSVYRCQSSRGPAGAWPMLAAIALITLRRRRGSSSAR